MRLFHRFVLIKYLIYKSCNLISLEYFGLYLRNKIFPKEKFYIGSYPIGFIQEHSKKCKKFIIEQIKQKLMTKIFLKFKKTTFWHISQILGAETFFRKN